MFRLMHRRPYQFTQMDKSMMLQHLQNQTNSLSLRGANIISSTKSLFRFNLPYCEQKLRGRYHKHMVWSPNVTSDEPLNGSLFYKLFHTTNKRKAEVREKTQDNSETVAYTSLLP